VQSKTFDVYMPFVEHLGFRLLEKRDGKAKVGYDPKPEHFNSWKAIHGGAVMSLLDVALSSACRALDDKCIGCLTVEMKANFIGAATGPVVAEARAQRAGRSLLFSEGEVRDESGAVLAKAVGTFKLIYPPGSKE
jgi:uncharacterized protein (TIGR00369 family)